MRHLYFFSSYFVTRIVLESWDIFTIWIFSFSNMSRLFISFQCTQLLVLVSSRVEDIEVLSLSPDASFFRRRHSHALLSPKLCPVAPILRFSFLALLLFLISREGVNAISSRRRCLCLGYPCLSLTCQHLRGQMKHIDNAMRFDEPFPERRAVLPCLVMIFVSLSRVEVVQKSYLGFRLYV